MVQGKKIGIWGFGVVGKSATQYLHAQGALLEVIDARTLSTDEQQFLTEKNITWYDNAALTAFLERNTYIVPSPGIDLRAYGAYAHKWISELDLFQEAFARPIIAITGSVGKTTVTHLLSQLLAPHMPIATGGNIGIGMLDLVPQQAAWALLEVSSFQLELCKTFAPTISVWTNFHPNHLDRHASEEGYFDAKYAIISRQTKEQHALVPLALQERILAKKPAATLYYVSVTPPTTDQIAQLRDDDAIIWASDTHITLYQHASVHSLAPRGAIPSLSFMQNWLFIIGVLHVLNIPIEHTLQAFDTNSALPEHRLEFVATVNGTAFYNDSKSTTPVSTLAAVEQFRGTPLHLFLGGVSKGVNRAPLVAQLKDAVHTIYCFGKEANELKNFCDQHGIPSSAHASLQEAFSACTQSVRAGDVVLFCPAGASYDLFKNYIERGNRFKQLVESIIKR